MENVIKSTAFDNKLIPVKDFAEKHGITVQAVYQGIKRGKYQSVKFGTYTLIKV
jgi:predicted DNA-binding protein YlxM (UPF0122 family)